MQGSICSTSNLQEAKPCVDSATKTEGRHRCRASRTQRDKQVIRAGALGGCTEEVWHPSWTLKNEEVVERRGQ